jgi:riboflavin kinase/FMN adenylyltransferase
VQLIRGLPHADAWSAAAIAIGNFDGVHLGHRALVRRARELADARGLTAVALTFDPHPHAVLSSHGSPPQLTSLERRAELLCEAGADAVVALTFTRQLAQFPAPQFVDDILLAGLRASAIVVGYDFAYGRDRGGNVDTLRAHGGCTVDVIEPVTVAGEVASSSHVRAHLRAGNLAAAERLLGRRWDIDGTVVHGAKRGRAIGVPTANIHADSDLPVAPGIYAVLLTVDGNPLPAVASLGTNPTFVDSGALVLEVHVLDFDGDLYDRHVRTTFVARLRDELKFDSVDALIEQIRRDIDAARHALAAR